MNQEDKKQKPDGSFTPRYKLRAHTSELERQKILIVDDKKKNLIALRKVLAHADFDIIEATSGNEALAATLDHRFTVAILDVMMPGMDGYELAEHLRGDARTRRMPIIFLTAFSSDEERVFKGYEVGAVDYIVKPYNSNVLLAKVSVFLELERTRAELAEKVVTLTASEQRYRSLVMTIPDIVYHTDTDGRFTYLNDAIKALDYAPEDLLGSHFSKILVPSDVENLSRESVLPKYRNKSTGPEGAPKLFDERRTGERITMGLEVRLLSRKGDGSVLAELHSSGQGIIIAEINSSGMYSGEPDGKKTVFLGTVGVIRDITERKRAEEELAKHRGKLKELVRDRVKEQSCLYGISEVLAEPNEVLNDVLRQVVHFIPSGWQYADIACARLRLDDYTVTSKPFRESQWWLAADIVVRGQTRGTVEVFYMEELPAADQGPFLKEEKELITDIARILGQAADRTESLTREQHLNAVLQGIRNVNQLIVSEKNRDRLIHAVCDALVRDRGFIGVWFVLTDPFSERVKAAHCGFIDKAFSELVILFEKGELPACCRRSQAEPGIITITNPALDCEGCPQANAYRGAAALLTKLEYQGRRFGYMGISMPPQFAADEEEHCLLEEISGDIAFALHTMKIEEKRKMQEQELVLRNRIMEIILTVSDEKMFGEVLSAVLKALKSEFGLFGYCDEKGDFICPNMTREIWERCNVPDKDIVFPRKKWSGIWGRAMVEKKTLYSNNPFKVPQGHIRINNALDVPLIHQGKLIGNFLVAAKETDYNEKDIQLLETIASHIAPIINARLQRDREEKARTESQAALRKSEQTLQAIFESARDGILLADAETHQFVRANTAMSRMLGYSPDEIRKLSVNDIHPSEDLPRVTAKFDKQLRGEITLAPDIPVKRKDGSIFPADVNAACLELNGRQHLLGIFRDITKAKQAEEERRKLEAQLSKGQKMEAIGILAGGIAHDFNNILSSIIGFTELTLNDVEKGSTIEDNLQEVYTAGKRATDLVRQIFAFARQSDEELKPIRVDNIIKEVLKFIRSSIPTTIEVKHNIKSDSLIMGNYTQVHQILMNLCINAAHAMEYEGGIVEISLKDVVMDRSVDTKKLGLTPGNYIEMMVSDTGTGIAPDIIDSIFEPYFTTKGPGEGTGMGLAIVHGIIESYGGNISVHSILGKGTVFTIHFPITKKRIEHTVYQPQALPSGTERILFVDDEAPITKIVGKVLEQLGYTVTIKTSSLEALELFYSKPNDFDLVITDMTMPNMTGDKLAGKLMTISPDIPVILCTGYSKKISNETGKEIGIKAFAYKPIIKADLAKMVRKVLDEAKR